MKKTLATTIVISSIAVFLFFASACFDVIETETMIHEHQQQEIKEEAREEAIKNKSGEKAEEDPEGSETGVASDVDDEDNSTNGEVTEAPSEESEAGNNTDGEADISTAEAPQEDILASIPVYPNITEVYDESYDQDKQRYSLFAYTDDAPDTVHNWYKDKSKSIGWEIWKEYDEEGGFIANYKDFRLVVTVVYIENNYYPDTRITVGVR